MTRLLGWKIEKTDRHLHTIPFDRLLLSAILADVLAITIFLLMFFLWVVPYLEMQPTILEIQRMFNNGTFDCCQTCDLLKKSGVLKTGFR